MTSNGKMFSKHIELDVNMHPQCNSRMNTSELKDQYVIIFVSALWPQETHETASKEELDFTESVRPKKNENVQV